MSKMVEIDWNPEERTLRQFGFIALAGFGFIAVIAWFEVLIFAFGLGAAKPWVAGIAAGLAALSALFSLVAPRANRPIFVGLAVLTFPIGFVLSYVILGTLFYGLIAPVAIVFKLTGRDPMHRGYDPEASSYWTDARSARAANSYFRQY
ncbi:MAG: SxtJ family membrane protein [Myxococcota bacterium]